MLMNYEFEPTLTTQAQNSYAESMSGPNGGETNQSAAEAEAAANAKTAESPLDKPLESSDPKQMAREMANNFYDELRRKMKDEEAVDRAKMRAEGRIDVDKIEDIEASASGRSQDPLQQIKDTILNKNVSPEVQKQAFAKIKGLAQELAQEGVANSDIEALASADLNTISPDRMKRLLESADRNNGLARAIQEAQENQTAVGPGMMARNEEQLEAQMNLYYPPSLEDVAEKAMDLESEEWRPGGEHEIIDVNGELKIWNLRRWMEEKWLKWGHQLSPDDPQQSPWNSVAVLSLYTQLDLMRLLTTSRYWRHKKVDLVDQVSVDGDGNEHVTKVPVTTYVKSDEYENLRADLLDQFWLFSKSHEWDATVRLLKGDEAKYLENIAQLYGRNVWLQGRDRLVKAWKKDATSGSEEQLKGEYDAWMKEKGTGGPQVEGRAGRAHRQADALYFRMAHLEKWNEDGQDYIARMSKRYDYSDNKFYEVLGEKGVKEFYASMVRRGLSPVQGEHAKFFGEISGLKGLDAASVMFATSSADIENALRLPENDKILRKRYLKEVLKEMYPDRSDIDQYSLNTIGGYIAKNFPEGGRANIQARVDAQIQQKINELVERAPQEGMRVREIMLNKLTSWDRAGRKLDFKGFAGFRDTGGSYVRDLFARASHDPMALEELGLRFMSLKVGDKGKSGDWEKGQGSKKWKDAWKLTKKELNLFNAQSKQRELDDGVRRAVRDAIGAVNDLDDFDAEYAENFAFSKVYFTFTSAYNDTTATGFDAGTKLMRFMDYRKNNMFGRKNYVGNTQNVPGVKRLLLTLWEGAYGSVENADGSRKKASLLSVMEHGFTDNTRRKGHENTLQTVDFDRGKEATFGSNHIMSAFKLYQRVLKGAVFSFEKYIKTDNFNNVQTNPEGFNEVLNEVNKSIRYTYNQLGLDFEDMQDEVEIIWERDADGKMSPSATFNKRKLKDALFGQEIVNMGMYEQREFAGNWVNKRIGMKDTNGEDMLTEYSRNVIAYYVAKEILEHRLYSAKDSSYNYNIWELDMIRAVEGFFANIPGGELEEMSIGLFNKNKKLRKTGSFFNRKEFKKIRLMGNAGYGKLWFEELRAQVAESAWKGNTGTANKFFGYIFQDMWSFK